MEDFLVVKGVVEGDEAAHGLDGVEGEDAEGVQRRGRLMVVVEEEAAEVRRRPGTTSHALAKGWGDGQPHQHRAFFSVSLSRFEWF